MGPRGVVAAAGEANPFFDWLNWGTVVVKRYLSVAAGGIMARAPSRAGWKIRPREIELDLFDSAGEMREFVAGNESISKLIIAM